MLVATAACGHVTVQTGEALRVVFQAGAPPVILILCPVQLMVAHRRSKRMSEQKVAEDVAGFERAWETITSSGEDQMLGIRTLAETEETILENLDAMPADDSGELGCNTGSAPAEIQSVVTINV
eukprot:3327064-Rhodomonas_salina.1